MTIEARQRAASAPAAVWTYLGSARFAVHLLLILAGAAVLGTVIPQYAPGQPEPNPAARVLQPHHIYHSWWFVALLVLISVNLAISSWRRGRRVWRQTRHPDALVAREQVAAMRENSAWEVRGGAEQAEARLVSALRGLGYRVNTAHGGGAIGIHAQRGTLGAWGSFVSHVSMLIVFAGAAFGRLPGMGFDVLAAIAVGSQYEIPKSHLSVALRRTDQILDQQFRIAQWESDLEILRDGKPVARKTISVNHPLSYGGYNMYQTTWGPEVQPGEIAAGEAGFDLVVRPNGGEPYRVPVTLPLEQPGLLGKVVEIERPQWRLFLQEFQPGALMENGTRKQLRAAIATVYLLGNAAGEGGHGEGGMGFVKLDAIQEGKPIGHEGVTLGLENVRLRSGIEIRRDPGVPIVWVGCALLVVGLFLTFYIWPRTIRVHISGSGDRTSVVAGAAGRGESRVAADLRGLEGALRSQGGRGQP